MKLILSRKGFDSKCGGCASPILPDGRLLSLPIPQPDGPTTYGELRIPGGLPGRGRATLGDLVGPLTRSRIGAIDGAHLDPDLAPATLDRRPGWRPLFGQTAAAQSHLAAEGVGVGDLFLFFGWFRAVEPATAGWRFVRGAPDLNVVFGWLQVGAVYRAGAALARTLPWAAGHPHLTTDYGALNTVYVAGERLVLPNGAPTGLPGAGVAPRFTPPLQLTERECSRSLWRLPGWMLPASGPALSYHRDPSRWEVDGAHVRLRSARRGQEFVLDVGGFRERAATWLRPMLGL